MGLSSWSYDILVVRMIITYPNYNPPLGKSWFLGSEYSSRYYRLSLKTFNHIKIHAIHSMKKLHIFITAYLDCKLQLTFIFVRLTFWFVKFNICKKIFISCLCSYEIKEKYLIKNTFFRASAQFIANCKASNIAFMLLMPFLDIHYSPCSHAAA